MKPKTIKALVHDHILRTQGHVDPLALEKEVLASFPSSKWKKTHWSYYKSRAIHKGEFAPLPEGVLQALAGGRTYVQKSVPVKASNGRRAADPEVQRVGNRILEEVRQRIQDEAAGNPVLQFKINRWVFARLLIDERKQKAPIKKALWQSGIRACQGCATPFSSPKNVEIHRKDSNLPYSLDNCLLLCRPCHEKT